MIPNLTIGDLMIDCADARRARDFYDTHFGAPSKGSKRVRGTEKAIVMVAVSKMESGKPNYLKMKVLDYLMLT